MSFRDRLYTLSREQMLERPISREIEGGEARAEVEWKLGTAADIDALSEETIQYNEGRKQFGKRMLSEGSVCLIGYIEGEAAHVGWMSFDRIFSPPFVLPLGPGWAYFHRTRTAPKFRGKGLQGAGIKKRLEIARARGIVRAVNMVDTVNAVSLHNYRKLGFTDTERIWSLEIMGRKIAEGIPESLKTRIANPAQE